MRGLSDFDAGTCRPRCHEDDTPRSNGDRPGQASEGLRLVSSRRGRRRYRCNVR